MNTLEFQLRAQAETDRAQRRAFEMQMRHARISRAIEDVSRFAGGYFGYLTLSLFYSALNDPQADRREPKTGEG